MSMEVIIDNELSGAMDMNLSASLRHDLISDILAVQDELNSTAKTVAESSSGFMLGLFLLNGQ